MAKFLYKMENILSIKYKLEDQAKNEFGQAQLVLNQEEEKLDNLKGRRNEYEDILTGKVKAVLNISEIKRCEDAVEVLKYQINMQTVVVNAAMQQLELARIKLAEAMIERKTHEKLKENAFEEFKKEIEEEERKEVDELVSFTFGKK